MPYYGDRTPYYHRDIGPYSNHSSLLTGVNRYFNPIAARYSPHLSTISETPYIARRLHPTSSISGISTASFSRPRRIIDTADIDVSKSRRNLAQESRPHKLRRDRPTIKIRSQALKDNPALREYNERHEKNMGELLVEKFLIRDRQIDENDSRIGLCHQVALAHDNGTIYSNDSFPSLPAEESDDEILAAIRRRVTRRMTRRRSSADVMHLDPEQIKREAVLQAAQAEVLDSLVAQEQAEIEVEVRKGTFTRRPTLRLPIETSGTSATECENEDMHEDSSRDQTFKRNTAKKKKRKKIEAPVTDSLISKGEIDDEANEDENTLEIPESVLEEQEEELEDFQWDDRKKCDDINQILEVGEPGKEVDDITQTGKTVLSKMKRHMTNDKTRIFGEKGGNIHAKKQESKVLGGGIGMGEPHSPALMRMKQSRTDKNIRVDARSGPVFQGNQKSKSILQNSRTSNVELLDENDDEEIGRNLRLDKCVMDAKSEERARTCPENDGVPEEQSSAMKASSYSRESVIMDSEFDNSKPQITQEELKHSSKDQPATDFNGVFSHSKIEACNSVDNIPTLYMRSFTDSERSPAQSIEQFRESVRLPAPRREASSSVETEVVLPVRKPYRCDTSRNSVHLALKSSQFGSDKNKNVRGETVNDASSTITNDMRKRSEGITEEAMPMLAKHTHVAADRSITQKKSISTQEGYVSSTFDDDATAPLTTTELNCSEDPKLTDPESRGIPEFVDGEAEFGVVCPQDDSEAWRDDTGKQSYVKFKRECNTRDVLYGSNNDFKSAVIGVSSLEKSKEKIQATIVDSLEKSSPSAKKTAEPTNISSVPTTSNLERAIDLFASHVRVPNIEARQPLGEIIDKTDDSQKNIPINSLERPLSDTVADFTVTIQKDIESTVSVSQYQASDNNLNNATKTTKNTETQAIQPQEEESCEQEKTAKISYKNKEGQTPDLSRELISQRTDIKKDKKPSSQAKATDDAKSDKKKQKSDPTKVRHELLRIDHRHLPKIPEEPKTASPLENRNFELLIEPRKPSEQDNKSTVHKSEKGVADKVKPPIRTLSIESVSSGQATKVAGKKGKDELKKKRVDAEAVMKIEKRILEDSESPCKIVSSAMPAEPLALEETAKKDEQGLLAPTVQRKVGLQPSEANTRKKSTEPIAAAAQRLGSEIDFWSEIKAAVSQEGAKVSEQPEKAQLAIDLSAGEKLHEVIHDPVDSSLELNQSQITPKYQDDLETPLTTEIPQDVCTSSIPDLCLALPEGARRSRSPLFSCHSLDDNLERSATVKKISKWSNVDNLASLNEADQEATTPLASNEPSPVASAASSTVKKKKVVKRKKSTVTQGKKDPSEKAKSTKKKTPTSKKCAASPQTSILRGPTSASGRNSPAQRPADLTKMFYTTPAILLTATPRDLRKVRRAKVKRKKPQTRTPSLSSDSTGSTRSTATNSNSDGSNAEEDLEHKRLTSTRSNDSGFDGSPRLSTPSQSSENQRNAEGDHCHHSGRITPPATNLPRFKKYEVTDFNFLKVLGKGSFGKVLLSELRGTECVYAVKCLKKDVVLEDDDVECTLIERKVLTLATRHPYLCHLFCTFQTESHLFFVMEYLNGGDLMFHIQKSGRFSEARAKFYAAEIWSGLIFLHKKGIVYRDLKLDNVLLDFEGHIRIADFGMCKLQIYLDRTADTFCGTPDYMAPEIIKGLKYNQAVDWWSFGVLLYEMLTGQSPFSGCDEDELFWSICNERPFIPRYLGQSATELLVALLEKDSGRRIPGHEIACHSFFCNIAWDKLERRQLEAPFKPAVEHTLDTRYFDTAFTTERPRLTPVPEHILSSMDQVVFRGFSYTNPNATD